MLARRLACLVALATIPSLAIAEPLQPRIVNHSVPTLCAEEDNVDVRLEDPRVRRFRVEATHPAVIGTIVVDSTAPDFTNCTITDKADHRFTPRRVIMHDDARIRVVGITFDKFWRPERVPLTVGARREEGFHLVQLFWKQGLRRPYEFLVLYPVDGYWRIKPRPPRHMRDVIYGSSFLVGPIEINERPVVNIADIRFDPATLTFDIGFRMGGRASVVVSPPTRERAGVDVSLDRVVTGRPFAGLRSMYVTETNADGAHIAWREAGAKRWQESPVMTFGGGQGIEAWIGRNVPSRHNTSAPDHAFSRFEP